MSPISPGFQGRGLQSKLTLVFLGVALLVSAATSLVLYQVAREQATTDLRQRLGDVVAIAAAGLDADRHASITPETGMDSESYRSLKRYLQGVRDSALDLHFVYTMRRAADGTIRFVVDAEEDPGELSPLNSVYSETTDLLLQSFDSPLASLVERDVDTDQWGTWLSAYAPIVTSTGERDGVLGADISATTVLAYERRVLWIALTVFAATLPLILLAGWWMGRAMARPIGILDAGARRIAEGDLGVRLRLDRHDEIGALARSFNHMAEELTQGRRRIEEAAAKYRSIFDNAAEGIFQSTADGRVITANRALLRMLGHGDREEWPREIDDVARSVYANPEDRRRLLAQLGETGHVEEFETQLRRADGSTFWAAISMRSVEPAGSTQLLEGMVLDLSERHERRRAEREREAARAANEAKSGFLAHMSHEIRTPLNAILGLTDLVLRGELNARQRDYLDKVKLSAKALLGIINDILDFSKIEAGRLDLERTAFSLDEVLASLAEMFAYRAHEKEIELILSAAPEVPRALIGDPVRLGQILINLTGNAIKFTERGEVVVTVALVDPAPRALADGEVMLNFSVRDTGPGIAEDRLDAIFQSFAQADGSITRRHGGTGLGLAISRELVDLMGGDIQVASQVGQGSLFSARVVLGLQAEPLQIRPRTPLDLRGLRVLVVDDNATSREILISQLESFQMEPASAASGEEALECLADPAATFDLVLMDWRMPGMNGLETTRRLRQDLRLDKTPVVCMISAYAREDLMRPAERVLLDGFLNKPVNQSFLFDTIMTLFGHTDAVLAGGSLATGQPSAEAPPDFSGRRVLLVEDIEMNRLVALEWLTSVGLEVDTAENGVQAVRMADPASHDAVLMDLQMPVMDGLEATRRIRSDPAKAALPIIAMTAHALKGDLERCLAAGMNDYVAKPVEPERLFAALARWIAPGSGAAPSVTLVDLGSDPAQAAARSLVAELKLPGIDIAEGLSRANGNAVLYLKLLRGFGPSWEDTAARVEEDLAAGRSEEGRRRVHSVKGVAGNLGAQDLYARGQVAETWIAEGEFDPYHPIWRDFAEALSRVTEGLAVVPEPGGAVAGSDGEGRGMDSGALCRGLDAMIGLLDDDLGQAQARLDGLLPTLSRRLDPERVQTLLARIDGFEIDDAIATIKLMQEDLECDQRAG
ncbi:hybrid sensor histidine kinase/response regulator [Thiocystis violacea]|uniref:hybrid sensor histidine kinase/response regulator n=1 Tax=Thiocystis violacea TaxID=13725 RepID=UPI0019067F38|nr:response regulator [Thiocystis violacea]MBK1718429.1 histidine kinase [Thiocystis violacea]